MSFMAATLNFTFYCSSPRQCRAYKKVLNLRPEWGGGLNACQDGLGHLFREVQMGNCLIVEGSKMLARMAWGTYNHQHGNLTKLLNSIRK